MAAGEGHARRSLGPDRARRLGRGRFWTPWSAEPILVKRPIVVSPKGVRLCRPSERVFDLLEATPGSFTKEDGEVVRPRD